MASLLEVANLSRSFGGIKAVDSLSFSVESVSDVKSSSGSDRGGIAGLIGPNGAGKTTVFNLITGVYRPSEGAVLLDGVDLTGHRPDRIVRAGVARTFQNIRLFNRMTCLENIMVPLLQRCSYGLTGAFFRHPAARAQEKQVRSTALQLMDAMGIADTAQLVSSTLPYGLQRKLEIARALACAPKLLLLDEPAAGMNDAETHELAQTLVRVQKNFSVSILLIEHHINLVMDICSHIVVMERGRLLAEGPPREIRGDERVITAYLGRRKRHD